MLGFDFRAKVNGVGRYADPKAIEMGIERFESLCSLKCPISQAKLCSFKINLQQIRFLCGQV